MARKVYVLGYRTVLSPGSDSDSDITFATDHLDPHLLPGGRWILSGIMDDMTPATHLFCWDLASYVDGSPQQPAAAYTWEGQSLTDQISWIKTQFYSPKSVTLAISLSEINQIFDVLCLSWESGTATPLIEHIARFEDRNEYTEFQPVESWDLQGNYLIFSTVSCIITWNWKENLIGKIKRPDSDTSVISHWCSSFTLIPPYLYIFPRNMREITIVEIPKLHPMGSKESFELVQPVATISYPFLEGIRGFPFSGLYILEGWKPPALRSGIAILRLIPSNEDREELFYTISLRGTAAPKHAPQITEIFIRDQQHADCAQFVDEPGRGIIMLMDMPTKREDPRIISNFFPFMAEDGNFGQPVKRELSSPSSDNWGPLGPLCLVSGKAVFQEARQGPDPRTMTVMIAYFDHDDTERSDDLASGAN
ncbi:hypothetical protein DL93DRAFT_2079787 [Clavulina sp. PMI_390]|nr:hypothetical protein DL93DRAFT_2079787 [Clavulina sp. PMI_390]